MTKVGNWPALEDALTQIIRHPETWDQGVYITECGTAACVAGWVSQLGGYSPIRTPMYDVVERGPDREIFGGWPISGDPIKVKITGFNLTYEMVPSDSDLVDYKVRGWKVGDVVDWAELTRRRDYVSEALDSEEDRGTPPGIAVNLLDFGDTEVNRGDGEGDEFQGDFLYSDLAEALFSGGNSISDILGLVKSWAAADGHELPDHIKNFEPTRGWKEAVHGDLDGYDPIDDDYDLEDDLVEEEDAW